MSSGTSPFFQVMTQFPEIWSSNFDTVAFQTIQSWCLFLNIYYQPTVIVMSPTCDGYWMCLEVADNDISKFLDQGEITQVRG
jgi:hypothetical protein